MAIGDPQAGGPARVLAALVEHPETTATQLAGVAVVGVSTASKALTATEHAARPVGEKRQPADPPETAASKPPATWPASGQSATPTSDLLTVNEVATLWRVSKMTVYRMVHSGELTALRIGRSFRIPRDAVEASTPRPPPRNPLPAPPPRRFAASCEYTWDSCRWTSSPTTGRCPG